MQRTPIIMTACAALVGLAVMATPARAEEPEARRPFSVEIGPEAAVGMTGALAGGQLVLAWQPGFLGAQLAARVDAGLLAGDAYAVPSAGIRLGWLALEGGAVLKVLDAPAPVGYKVASVEGVTPFLRAGLAVPLGPVALDLGLRAMVTNTYYSETEDPPRDLEGAVGSAIGDIIAAMILTILGAVKVDLAVRYAFRF